MLTSKIIDEHFVHTVWYLATLCGVGPMGHALAALSLVCRFSNSSRPVIATQEYIILNRTPREY
jgi:hypothetical protein